MQLFYYIIKGKGLHFTLSLLQKISQFHNIWLGSAGALIATSGLSPAIFCREETLRGVATKLLLRMEKGLQPAEGLGEELGFSLHL